MRVRERSASEWILACALAEAIGMTAAAGAAKVTQALADGTGASAGVAVALAVLVAGGLVEGAALGVFQGRALSRRWSGLDRGRFLAVTVVVAGLGWAAGSVPGVLADDTTTSSPPLLLVALGGAGIGLVLGPLLGGVQAAVLREVVGRPWRWVLANAVAWPGAMAVIFVGASSPSSDWPQWVVVPFGTVVGAVAGTVLGAVSAPWLQTLDEVHAGNKDERGGVDQ